MHYRISLYCSFKSFPRRFYRIISCILLISIFSSSFLVCLFICKPNLRSNSVLPVRKQGHLEETASVYVHTQIPVCKCFNSQFSNHTFSTTHRLVFVKERVFLFYSILAIRNYPKPKEAPALGLPIGWMELAHMKRVLRWELNAHMAGCLRYHFKVFIVSMVNPVIPHKWLLPCYEKKYSASLSFFFIATLISVYNF